MSAARGTPTCASSMKLAGSGRASSLEPSPASTFGGSASSDAGDDLPQTPSDEGATLRKLSKLTIKVDKSDVKANVERYSPPFIRNGSHGRVEDPFTSPTARRGGSGQRTPTGPKFTTRSSKSDNWRSGSSAGSDSGSSSPSAAKALRSAQSGRGVYVQDYASESSQLRTAEVVSIKAEDAQGFYPPSSCVFVANLLQSESDETLEVAVTQIFREYGTVFVKIRRDSKHMPFAFCQFTNDRDAARAIKEGRGRTIKGRPCRCEKAKAHRLFFFERKYGDVITEEEVERLLRGFGTITYCRQPSEIERVSNNLGEGVIVQFELYDEGQAALQAFRNHDEFKMQSLANHLGGNSPARGRAPEDPTGRHYLEEYDIERRSIYVGNLPTDAVNDDLRDLFVNYGKILKVTLHKNESIVDATQQRCFAFVEFDNQPSVLCVLGANASVGFAVRGMVLRVTQKDTNAAFARSQRRRSGYGQSAQSSVASYQSPPPQPTTQQYVASPFAGTSPQVYGSPYSQPAGYSPYSPVFYGYGYSGYGTPMYASSQAYVYPTFYASSSSPTYNAGGGTASSPVANNFSLGYSPTSAYGASSSVPQSAFQASFGQYVPTTSPLGQEDRSSTPTPTGHISGFEALDSQ